MVNFAVGLLLIVPAISWADSSPRQLNEACIEVLRSTGVLANDVQFQKNHYVFLENGQVLLIRDDSTHERNPSFTVTPSKEAGAQSSILKNNMIALKNGECRPGMVSQSAGPTIFAIVRNYQDGQYGPVNMDHLRDIKNKCGMAPAFKDEILALASSGASPSIQKPAVK